MADKKDDKRPEWTRGRSKGNWIILAVLVLFVIGWYGFFLANTASRAAG